MSEVPDKRKKQRLYVWFSYVWLCVVIVIPYGSVLLLLLAVSWPNWRLGDLNPALNAIIYAVTLPAVAAIVAVIPPFLKKRLWRYIRSLRKPLPLVVLTLASAIVSGFALGTLIGILSPGPISAIVTVSASPHEWRLKSIDADIAKIGVEELLTSSHSDQYRAYVFSIAARGESTVSHPEEERTLLDGTGAGKPLTVRIISHLGLANLNAATGDAVGMQSHLDQAEAIAAISFAPDLRRLVLSTRGMLAFRRAQQEPERKKEWLDIAERAYDEWFDLAETAGPWEECQVLNGRAIVRFLRGDRQSARQDWERIIEEAEDAKHPINKAMLSTVHNNIGLTFLGDEFYDDATHHFREALALGEGDTRTTELNIMICLRQSGKVDEAIELASRLEPTTARLAEYALFGWTYLERQRKLHSYARALDRRELEAEQLTPGICKELAKLCNDAFVGLHFDPTEFAILADAEAGPQ